MICFKVVRRGLRSFAACPGIQYKVNEWVEPEIPGSLIFVFATLKDAISFKGDATSPSIYKCEYRGERHKINKRSQWPSEIDISAFWNGLLSGWDITTEIPTGTFGVEALKLLEEVK